jgi:hypothetical protein
MATPTGALSILGIPDPRDKTKQDLVNMFSDYIMTGGKPAVRQFGLTTSQTSNEPGWGEPSEISEEENISQDKGQIAEVDEKDEKANQAAAAADEQAATDAETEAEAVDEAGPLSSVSSEKNTYENEILKELQSAREELLKQKKLSISDILGAGNIRKSAQLIRETEKLNEERQMKARELALDILMRKSASEEKRKQAEDLAEYRKGIIAARMAAANKPAEEVDKQVRARAVAQFPNLSPEAAYQKYVREILNRPPAGREPRPEDYRIRMGRLIAQQEAAEKNQGPPVTPSEAAEIAQYKRQLNFLDLIRSGALK